MRGSPSWWRRERNTRKLRFPGLGLSKILHYLVDNVINERLSHLRFSGQQYLRMERLGPVRNCRAGEGASCARVRICRALLGRPDDGVRGYVCVIATEACRVDWTGESSVTTHTFTTQPDPYSLSQALAFAFRRTWPSCISTEYSTDWQWCCLRIWSVFFCTKEVKLSMLPVMDSPAFFLAAVSAL